MDFPKTGRHPEPEAKDLLKIQGDSSDIRPQNDMQTGRHPEPEAKDLPKNPEGFSGHTHSERQNNNKRVRRTIK